MVNCKEGHPILPDKGVCSQGHPAASEQPAGNGPTASGAIPPETVTMMFQTMQLMHQTMQQMLPAQQQMLPAQQQTNPFPHGRVKRPERPTIDIDSSDSDWAMFLDPWTRYKVMTEISDPSEIRNELRSTCSQVVNRLLFDFVGAHELNTCTEEQLLAHIKSVAVSGVHKEVHPQRFHGLRQSPGESITRYLARLRAQATLCEFNIPCPSGSCHASVSYAEDMISGQMIVALTIVEHQGKILAEATSLTTLHAKFDKLVSLETTNQTTSHLHHSFAPTAPAAWSETAAQKSQYSQQKRQRKSNQGGGIVPNLNPCKGC